MGFIFGALKVIILLGTLIIIHEFGHFIVAKLCGMKVLKFSIGFGPKIFKKQGKETEYSLRALPLGGFVQLEGEEEESKDPRAFMNKPAWQRLLVLLAGVTINILFALLIYIGINMSVNKYTTTKIVSIPIGSVMESIEFNVDEKIYKINGERTYNPYDISRIINDSESDLFEIEIIDSNNQRRKNIVNITPDKLGYIGASFVENVVYSLEKSDAAERAGLQVNDEILSINGEAKQTINEYLAIIQSSPEKELNILVKRNDEEISIKVTPEIMYRRFLKVEYEELENLGVFDNLYYAINETIYYLRANLTGLGELFAGNTENVEVQGIVGISKQISATEKAIEFFYMMSAISLSLGIMNLLPIPGLDGGKVVFTLIEMIRKKPIRREIEGAFTLIGFAALIILMIVVTVGDVASLL